MPRVMCRHDRPALGHFCFGLCTPICRKGSAYVNLFLKLTDFITPDVASIPFVWLHESAFTVFRDRLVAIDDSPFALISRSNRPFVSVRFFVLAFDHRLHASRVETRTVAARRYTLEDLG